MGVWGSGNLENDEAGEYLDSIIRQLLETVENCIQLKGADDPTNILGDMDGFDSKLMPTIDILTVLCEHYHFSALINETSVIDWKKTALQRWDENIDDYGLKPSYKMERRKVIEDSFSKLEAIARKRPS